MIAIQKRFDEPSIISRKILNEFDLPTLVSDDIKEAIDEFESQDLVQITVQFVQQNVALVLILERNAEEASTSVLIQDDHQENLAYCVAYDNKPCHWDEWVDKSMRELGVMTLLRTIMEEIEGFSRFETVDTMDRLFFHLKRGFAPVSKVSSENFYTHTGQQPLDEEEVLELLESQLRFPFGIRMEYKPEAAKCFLEKLIRALK